MNFKTLFTVLVAATAVTAGPAFSEAASPADTQASYAFQLEGYVPVICRVAVAAQAVPATDGQTDLGAMTEFCNSANGYQVWVDYSAALAGAALYVDGQRVALSPSGSTLISTSDTAAFRSRQLSFEGPAGQSAALSLRVVPL